MLVALGTHSESVLTFTFTDAVGRYLCLPKFPEPARVLFKNATKWCNTIKAGKRKTITRQIIRLCPLPILPSQRLLRE